jgi:LPXTG-site transpeptidase (sortase) family protein
VALLAVAGIVVALLAMTPSVAVGGGVDPGSAGGYGLDIAPRPSSAPVPSASGEAGPAGPVPAASPDVPGPPAATAPSVPVTSARFDDLAPSVGPSPVGLRIPAIGVDAPIVPVGYEGDEMEVPATAADVGWFRYGPAPGHPGSSVLAAHVAWRGEAGVFFDLADLPSGSTIEVQFDDGSTKTFQTVALTSYDKQDLPVAEIFRRDGPPVLTLITCGGAFNPSLRSYEDNVVAYAVEVSEIPLR